MSKRFDYCYFHLEIARIPIGHIPEDYGDGCIPEATKEETLSLEDSDSGPWLSIEDNGTNGDGLSVSLFRGDINKPFASFGVPDSSLDLIIEAMTAVKRLRQYQQEASAAEEKT